MKNLFFYVLSAVAGLVYLGTMLATHEGSLNQVIGFTMAMSNTYGILLITVLMGNGVVGLPRRLWRLADTSIELHRLYLQVHRKRINI